MRETANEEHPSHLEVALFAQRELVVAGLDKLLMRFDVVRTIRLCLLIRGMNSRHQGEQAHLLQILLVGLRDLSLDRVRSEILCELS